MSKQRGEINVRQVAVIASAGMGFLSFPGVIILVVAIGVCILMASGGSAQPANASQPAGCFGSDADAGAGTGTAAAAADSLAKLTAAQVTNLRAIDVAARAAHADSTAEATLLATASAQTSLLNVANDGTSTETAVFGSGAARTLTDPERAAAKTSLQLPHDSVTHHLNALGVYGLQPTLGWSPVTTLMNVGQATSLLDSKLSAIAGWATSTAPWTITASVIGHPELAAAIEAKYPTAVTWVTALASTPPAPSAAGSTAPAVAAAVTAASSSPAASTTGSAAAPPTGGPASTAPATGYTECGSTAAGALGQWDPGNIISDQVFYNATSMTVPQIRTFIAAQDAACPDSNPWCSRTMQVTWPAYPADQYCQAVPAQTDVDTATAIAAFSTACGINPQVMLTTWQKESQGLSRPDPSESSYAAAWGYACPDAGPGGSAACDSGRSGFIAQLEGMAHQWAKYRVEIPNHKYNYAVGTYTILWNIAESNCGGGAPVNIANVATASLYVYTPYQPNAASLAAYPGEGDKCSSYWNRNFRFIFEKYFGSTGGGAPAGSGGGVTVTMSGTSITLPDNPNIDPSLRGKTVSAPNAQVAAGLAWAISNALGVDYVYGGGGLGSKTPGGPDDGCARGAHEENACQGLTGYDCSGLSWTVYDHMNPSIQLSAGNSGDMSSGGVHIPTSQALPGDLLTYYNDARVGHVAVSLGYIDGQLIIMEAPDVGQKVRIVPNFRPGDMVTWASRYWTSGAA